MNATVNLGVAAVSSGTLNYTGSTGTLDKNINALGNGADTVQNSGTGLLTLSGTLTKNGTHLTLKGGANGINVTGPVVGAAAGSDLIVTNGKTTLSNAANTYAGNTVVGNGGTLVVSGSLNGTANVNVGDGINPATLGGTGTIATANLGQITVANNAILAPDQTPGTSTAGLSIYAQPSGTSTVAFQAGATLQLTLANSHVGTGAPLAVDYSKLSIGTGVAVNVGNNVAGIATTVSPGTAWRPEICSR